MVLVIPTKNDTKLSYSFLLKVARALMCKFTPFIVDISELKQEIRFNLGYKFTDVEKSTFCGRLYQNGFTGSKYSYLTSFKTKKELVEFLIKMKLVTQVGNDWISIW